MVEQLVLSSLYDWAASHPGWRGTYRLKRWLVKKKLGRVQQLGRQVSVIGPIRVENAGHLALGNRVELKSSWHRPIGLFVTQPAALLTIGDYTFVNWGVTIGVAVMF